MAKTRSMTRNQNHDDDNEASSSSMRKRFKTFDKADVASWSDLNDDLLFIVMMRLGVVDFLAFSGVCKSWRSFALINRKLFMASRPPMSISFKTLSANNQDSYCCLEDYEGRKSFRTILPHCGGRRCVGVTCGYVILFGRKTRDFFWLVNPITRHQLHFPDVPLAVCDEAREIKVVLVFSHSISGWVFVVVCRKLLVPVARNPSILFCIAGKRRWNHVSTTLHTPRVFDLHVFKGKIYTLHKDCLLGELRLNLKEKGKSALLKINNLRGPHMHHPRLVSSNENLYLINQYSSLKMVKELDIGEMKWVSPEKTIGEYAFFISYISYSVAIKPKSWAAPQTSKCYNYLLDVEESE